jgi:uncharacterized protein (UPF0371 family)
MDEGSVMIKTGFNNDLYLRLQSQKIRDRIEAVSGKLYLEFGGKLFDDFHASRVLPGFAPDSKVRMLAEFSEDAEIVIAINAGDIESNKRRGDLGITYDVEIMRLIDAFRGIGLYIGSIVMTQYRGQRAADVFAERMQNLGIRVYRHYPIEGYPTDVSHIVSEEGFGKNEYIETSRRLIIVTAPGPGSGKMATCLSQLYHDHMRGISAGYAKFETFPVWNLPLNHPVNLAYEAATADLDDVNMIDSFHLDAYGTTAVNYNRDIEIFPVLRAILSRIYGSCPYKSPTDMGVNMAGFAIFDDEAVSEASRQEIIRRSYKARCQRAGGGGSEAEIRKLEILMNTVGVDSSSRACVAPALAVAERTDAPAVSIELPDGRIVTGKTSSLLGSASAAMLNAMKALVGIDDGAELISSAVIEPIQKLKVGHMGAHNPRMHIDELLIALSICAVTDPIAARAMQALDLLRGSEVHSSVILSSDDESVFRKLGMNVTCEPVYQSKKLYHR